MTDTREAKRALIMAARGRFCSVTFTKKDGTERTLNFAPAHAPSHVQGAATESGARAAETRKANNPNLVNVWSVADAGWRCVNLDSILTIRVDGETHNFA